MTDADNIFHLDGAIRIAEARADGSEIPRDDPRANDLAWSTMFALPYKEGESSFDGWRRTAERLRETKRDIIAEVKRGVESTP